jgi:hypothetical protein
MGRAYVCPHCLWPVFFRYRPPQVYHVGTGWYFWERLQRELGEGRARRDLPLLQLPVGKPTPHKKRKELRLAFARHYRRYLDDGAVGAAQRFVRNQLRAGRIDVLVDVLVFLSEQRDKRRTRLLRHIVESPSWQGFAQSLEPLDERQAA